MTRYVSKVEATDCCQAWEPSAQFPRREKEDKPEGHCFRDLQQTKRGKWTHSLHRAVWSLCLALKAGGTCGGSGFHFPAIDCIRRRVEAAGLQVLFMSAVHVRVRRHTGQADVTEARGADSSRGVRKHKEQQREDRVWKWKQNRNEHGLSTTCL